MNKTVYLGLSILEISKTLIYKLWYGYIKMEDFYKDIADDVKKRYDTSDYKVDILLPKEMNKRVIGLMKD